MQKKYLIAMTLLTLVLALTAQATTGYRPGDQSLMLVPTAYTMPAGSHAITNYEVIVIQYAYAFPTNTHVSIMSAMPVWSDFVKTITLGVKQRYFVKGIVQSSAFASFNPDIPGYMLGNVVSIGQPSQSLHLGLMYGWADGEGMNNPLFFLGGRKDVGAKIALMAEFGSTIGSTNADVNSLISFGVRFISSSISWDLGGVRPVGEDMGDLYFIPVLKATFEF
ncbi:MAG: hypothetical protein PHR32_00725 [Candidatus Cloacimonetes bacterium]|nr:hypothetical protein [Candidatus Cloacimonadota bacterium]